MAPANMEPNEGLYLARNSSFSQQASWNMFEMMKLPVQASLGLLARYNASRVNPYTALVGELICQNFEIGKQGRVHVETAVQRLKVVGSWGDALEFGFGVEDVVRGMARSQYGCTSLALCATLMECYSEEVAVEVLLELAHAVKVEKQYMPSSQSWRELLGACAGIVSSSKFPFLVEHFYGSIDAGAKRSTKIERHSVPSSLAAALMGIAKVSRGELRSITIYGTFDAVWMAALSEWLFDLRIEIKKEDDSLYYRSSGDDATNVQVEVYMRTKPKSWATNSLRTESTFLLEDVSVLFNNQTNTPGKILRNEVVSGRLPWDKLFSSTFPLQFRYLMTKVPLAFGSFLGKVARILKGLCEADTKFPLYCRIAYTNYSYESYGTAFITNLIKLFPELSPLEHTMLEDANANVKTFLQGYESSRALICRFCRCEICAPDIIDTTDYGRIRHDFTWKTPKIQAPQGSPTGSVHENDDDGDLETTFEGTDAFCPAIVAETIAMLAMTLTKVWLEDENLLPTRSGIQMTYERQFHKHIDAANQKIMEDLRKELGEFAYLLNVTGSNASSLHLEDLCFDSYRSSLKFDDVLELFTGKPMPPVTQASFRSAVSSSGICAFLGVLRQEGMEDADLATKIHILPGRIYYETKRYEVLEDYKNLPDSALSSGATEAEKLLKFNSIPLQNTLLVKESHSSLQVWIEIRFTSTHGHGLDHQVDALCLAGLGDSAGTGIATPHLNISAGPAKLASVLAFRRGLIHCKKSRYLSKTMVESENRRECPWTVPASKQEMQSAVEKMEEIKVGTTTCHILKFKERRAAIAAVAASAHQSERFVIGRKECLNCCLKALLSTSAFDDGKHVSCKDLILLPL